MTTRSILLTEAKRVVGQSLFKALSNDAKRLLLLLSTTCKERGMSEFSVNMIRNTRLFRSTDKIRSLLYELESRDFGDVRVQGAEMLFVLDQSRLQLI